MKKEGGAVVVITSFLLFSFCLATALTVDIASAYMHQRQLQLAADSGTLAGVKKLAQGALLNIVTNEATELFNQNGPNYHIDLLQIGNWQAGQFTPAKLPFNAVLIEASYSSKTTFARVAGFTNLYPKVASVAVFGGLGSALCVVPYGVKAQLLDSTKPGDVIHVEGSGTGFWGKLDIPSNMSSGNSFYSAMLNGICGVEVSVGDNTPASTGFAQVKQAFEDRMYSNPVVTFPVVDEFSANTQVLGFVTVQLQIENNHGANWSFNAQVIDNYQGGPITTNTNPSYTTARTLVK